jgi:hypothetical protein
MFNALLRPNQDIKEVYKSRKILTVDGKLTNGIVVRRDERVVVVREASGHERAIPTADIDDEADGQSLMPDGLADGLDDRDLVDLAAFLCALGKPGPYEIPAARFVRTWRRPSPGVASSDDWLEADGASVLASFSHSGAWEPLYANIDGFVPWENTGSRAGLIAGQFEVSNAGLLRLTWHGPPDVTLVLGDQAVEMNRSQQVVVQVAAGHHLIRVAGPGLRHDSVQVALELSVPDGSTVEFSLAPQP